MSPDANGSHHVQMEVAHAAELKKRIIPLFYRALGGNEKMFGSVAAFQGFPFHERNFNEAFARLLMCLGRAVEFKPVAEQVSSCVFNRIDEYAILIRGQRVGLFDLKTRQETGFDAPYRIDNVLDTGDCWHVMVQSDQQLSLWNAREGRRVWTIEDVSEVASPTPFYSRLSVALPKMINHQLPKPKSRIGILVMDVRTGKLTRLFN